MDRRMAIFDAIMLRNRVLAAGIVGLAGLLLPAINGHFVELRAALQSIGQRRSADPAT